jgi:hypothetical protein
MYDAAEKSLGNLTCTMVLEPENRVVATYITLTEDHWEFLDAKCSLIAMADFSIDVLETPIHEIIEMFEEALTHLKERV